jgi:hypothetical protein
MTHGQLPPGFVPFVLKTEGLPFLIPRSLRVPEANVHLPKVGVALASTIAGLQRNDLSPPEPG